MIKASYLMTSFLLQLKIVRLLHFLVAGPVRQLFFSSCFCLLLLFVVAFWSISSSSSFLVV